MAKNPATINELQKVLDAEHAESDTGTGTLATLGCEYQIGNLLLPPLTMGVLPLLDLMESPFLSDGDGEVSVNRVDVVIAAYIIAHKMDVCRPLMGIRQRMVVLKKEEEFARSNPEFYKHYLDKIDEINKGKADFERDALEWFDSININDWHEVIGVIERMFCDLLDAMKPLQGEAQKKK